MTTKNDTICDKKPSWHQRLVRLCSGWAWRAERDELETLRQRAQWLEHHNETLKGLVAESQSWVSEERKETDIWRRRADRMREYIREKKGRSWAACRIRHVSW